MNRNERMIVRKMCELAVQHDWKLVAVDDGGDEPELISSVDRAIELGYNVDEIRYVFQKGDITQLGIVLCIFGNGNDGLDVVSDHHTSLDAFMDPLYEWVLELEAYWHGSKGYKPENFAVYNTRDKLEFYAQELHDTLDEVRHSNMADDYGTLEPKMDRLFAKVTP